MRILIIEDEPRMRELLQRGLQERDCAVMAAADGEAAIDIATAVEFDVILLDIGLPRCDGYEVLRMLRERKCATRVLMLTARDTEDDIIRGLELGADDYLTKPFSFPELVARLQSVTRPHQPEDARTFEWKNLRVDLTRRLVTRDEVSVDLTRSEFTLLLSLVRSAGQCVTRQKLTESIWGADSNIGSGALDVLVNALRGKIDGTYTQKLIHTVRRSGYMLYPAPPDTRHVRG